MRRRRDLDEWQCMYLLTAQQLRQAHPELALLQIEARARCLLVASVFSLFSSADADNPNIAALADVDVAVVGRVYEQCLSYRLVEGPQGMELAINQAARQHTGSYYTPLAVVQFVLEATVGQVVQTIKDEIAQRLKRRHYRAAQDALARLKQMKVLDISCGGGIFLLEAARLLIAAYIWWNEQLATIFLHDCQQDTEAFAQTGLLFEAHPAEMAVRNCVYGIDYDADAVEITKLGLMLLAGGGMAHDQGVYDALSTHIVHADTLSAPLDLENWLGRELQRRIIVGNPPWGTPVQYAGDILQTYTLAKGQYDSYELFIERATRWLREEDMLGYVVPDSMLHLPQHTGLRQLLLQSYHIDTLVKLGEGVFQDVFRGTVVFSAMRSERAIGGEHKIRCRIFVKAERQAVMQQEQHGIQALLADDGINIAQARFGRNKAAVFDLFTSREDEYVLHGMAQQALSWRELFTTGRGVEIAKTGAVMACPACGSWQNIPQKRKTGGYAEVQCIHSACRRQLVYEACAHETLIVAEKDVYHQQAIIVGEQVHRYALTGRRYLDVSKGPYINYKSPTLYAGEKLLVRKTGRGIYAMIDRTGAYTNQVVFIFKLKADLPEEQKGLRLSYVLGVLNSRMMLYRYYKALGDIEWKSFPYMTQDTIMGLPIRRIDFHDARQVHLHNRIADLVDDIVAAGQPPEQLVDDEIEQYVRALYGVDAPAVSAHIDAELRRISSYGSLLGEQK